MTDDLLKMTRAEAKAAGLTRYFTGRPCRRGHVAERDIDGNCVECSIQNARKWREATQNNTKPA